MYQVMHSRIERSSLTAPRPGCKWVMHSDTTMLIEMEQLPPTCLHIGQLVCTVRSCLYTATEA